MAVELTQFNTVYFPVPKVACTSIKHLLYLIEHGEPFQETVVDGKVQHIHATVYGTPSFFDVDHARYAGHFRFAVVRDPVARLLSAYTNRVVFYHELSERVIDADLAARLGVRPDPSIEEFIDGIDKYRFLSRSIWHHTEPQSVFLGPDLGYFDKVYRLSELSQMMEELCRRTGMALELPHEQSGGPKLDAASLAPRSLRRAVEYCSGDYALLRGYYDVPAYGNKSRAA